MRAKALFPGSAIVLVAAAVAIAAGQSPSPNPVSPSPQAAPPAQAPPSRSALRVQTHVVTIDVIATDSHGDVVRDLKPEEFEVSDGGRQKIAQFAFIDKSVSAVAGKSAALPKGSYTNQAKYENMTLPPTVVLMDALNTDIGNGAEGRKQMFQVLKTLPSDTPVAVFCLGQSLVVVQDFTSDPGLLLAALDKASKPAPPLDPSPENDPNAASLVAFDENGGQENFVSQTLEDFEKNNYSDVLDVRVRTTLDSLRAIARYLGGYPGRKNLVWVSESFPITLEPDPDFGHRDQMFAAGRSYEDEVRETAKALADAQVAVYPVEASGLQTIQVFGADQKPVLRKSSPSRTMSAQSNLEDNVRAMSQGSMDQVAEDTGGKTCKNTNNLSGCVQAALKDSSSYYELAYYPQDISWNGSFHTISVKTTRGGVRLAYRRGYFAQDADALAKVEPPEKRLQEACQDYLPSTSIPLTAQAVPSDGPDHIRYLTSVPVGALSIPQDGQSHKLNAEMATCLYSAGGGSFQFTPKDLSRTLSDADLNGIQTTGLRGYLDVPKGDTARVRFAIIDLNTGLTGALDIAVHPGDFVEASAAPATSATTASPAAAASVASLPTPVPSLSAGASTVATNVSLQPGYSVTFHSNTGATSALEWSGDAVSYRGDPAAAAAYFHGAFGAKFQCQNGKLIPSGSGGKPNLHLKFANPAGHAALVDLSGDAPNYSGDLPVDASAKPFFERLWSLCHCR